MKKAKSNTSDIQLDLDSALAEINEESLRIFETQITNSKEYRDAVVKVRNQFEIQVPSYTQTGKRDRVIISDVTLGESKINTLKLKRIIESQEFKNSIDNFMETTKLPKGWREYVIASITGQPVDRDSLKIFENNLVIVEEIDSKSITVKIAKGIKYDEYIKAWSALSEHLGKGRRKVSTRGNAVRDLQMYHSFYYRGLSHKEIANLYLESGAEYSVDAVKKAIKRQSTLFEKGIKLAQ